MFDEFTISGEAYERLTHEGVSKWFGAWPEVVRLLYAEGALSLADVGNELSRVGSVRGRMLKRDLKDVGRWAEAMGYHDSLFASADRALDPGQSLGSPFGWTYDPDVAPAVKGSDGKFHVLSAGPLLSPTDDAVEAHQRLHDEAVAQLRLQLQEVNAGIAVAQALDCAPMFWAPYKRYLQEKGRGSGLIDSAGEHAEAARLFFEIAFPRFRPTSARDLGRLRCDRRVRQLREVILSSARTGDVMDPRYPQRVLEQVVRVERKVGRSRQIVAWMSTALGLVPIPGLGIASAAAGELGSVGIERWQRREWNWFYLVSDGTGHS
jgi:hypothetical protein